MNENQLFFLIKPAKQIIKNNLRLPLFMPTKEGKNYNYKHTKNK